MICKVEASTSCQLEVVGDCVWCVVCCQQGPRCVICWWCWQGEAVSLGGWGRAKVGSSHPTHRTVRRQLELPSDPTLSYNSLNLQWIVNFQSRHQGSTVIEPLSQWRWWRWWRLYILVAPPLIIYPRSEAKIGYSTEYSDHTNTANMAHNYYQHGQIISL